MVQVRYCRPSDEIIVYYSWIFFCLWDRSKFFNAWKSQNICELIDYPNKYCIKSFTMTLKFIFGVINSNRQLYLNSFGTPWAPGRLHEASNRENGTDMYHLIESKIWKYVPFFIVGSSFRYISIRIKINGEFEYE